MAWATECRNGSRDPDHAPFKDDLAGWDLLRLTYLLNLKFPTTPITTIWKAVQNAENGVSLGRLGVTQGHG